MYIELKKVVVLFIFLLSVIIMLGFNNLSLNRDLYNVLVVSEEEDLSDESITKSFWDDLESIKYSYDNMNSMSVNYKYLEISDSKTFKATLEDNIGNNNLVVIIGNTYNSVLDKIFLEFSDISFLLIENELDFNYDNVYKINIEWADIFEKINSYLEEQYKELIDSKILEKGDELEVLFLAEDEKDNYYDEFKDSVKNPAFNIVYVDENSFNRKDFLEWYEKQNACYIMNLDFGKQEEIIKELVNVQKENVNKYYEDTTEKNPVKFEDDTKIKYVPINYIGLYEGDVDIGIYDNFSNDSVVEENIIVNTFEIDYKEYLKKIIKGTGSERKYSLNLYDNMLEFDII